MWPKLPGPVGKFFLEILRASEWWVWATSGVTGRRANQWIEDSSRSARDVSSNRRSRGLSVVSIATNTVAAALAAAPFGLAITLPRREDRAAVLGISRGKAGPSGGSPGLSIRRCERAAQQDLHVPDVEPAMLFPDRFEVEAGHRQREIHGEAIGMSRRRQGAT